jgi:hypothetical protein
MRTPDWRPRLALWMSLAVALFVAWYSTPAPLALFVDAAPVGRNTFTTAASFGCSLPGTQTVTASRDSWVWEASPTFNDGAGTSLYVNSRAGSNMRVLVGFSLPAVPAGCSVTAATLRLNASASAAGRTLQAFRGGAAWTETGVTWANQPATAGTPATAASALGWVGWTVTAQVQAMYSGANDGFLVRDSVEGNASDLTQQYSSREGPNPPQLVLTFG